MVKQLIEDAARGDLGYGTYYVAGRCCYFIDLLTIDVVGFIFYVRRALSRCSREDGS